jgi:lysyl-tRNA synthetase class I
MGMLTPDDCRELAKQCDHLAEIAQNLKSDMSATLTDEDNGKLIQKINTLREYADKLTANAIDLTVDDLEQPMKAIKESIQKIRKAIAKLKSIKKGIALLAGIIDVFSKIISATAGGGVALIKAGLEGINSLADE